jgi:hypothetical protein
MPIFQSYDKIQISVNGVRDTDGFIDIYFIAEAVKSMTKQELFDRADYYKGLIDRRGPFDAEKRKQLDNCVRIGFTFSSNSLEGNTLTIEDTKTLLEAGAAAGKKPDKDYYEADFGYGFLRQI